MEEGLGGWHGVGGVIGQIALTCHSHPLSPTLSSQGFSVQGQYGAVTPAEVSNHSPRDPFRNQASSDS